MMQLGDPLFIEETECPGLAIDRDGMVSCKFEEQGELPEDIMCKKLNILAGNPNPDEFHPRCPKIDPRT